MNDSKLVMHRLKDEHEWVDSFLDMDQVFLRYRECKICKERIEGSDLPKMLFGGGGGAGKIIKSGGGGGGGGSILIYNTTTSVVDNIAFEYNES